MAPKPESPLRSQGSLKEHSARATTCHYPKLRLQPPAQTCVDSHHAPYPKTKRDPDHDGFSVGPVTPLQFSDGRSELANRREEVILQRIKGGWEVLAGHLDGGILAVSTAIPKWSCVAHENSGAAQAHQDSRYALLYYLLPPDGRSLPQKRKGTRQRSVGKGRFARPSIMEYGNRSCGFRRFREARTFDARRADIRGNFHRRRHRA